MLQTETWTSEKEENRNAEDEKHIVIPVVQEFACVDKIKIATVTITKKVHEVTEVASLDLLSESYHIEHIEKGEYVDETNLPVARQEGDTLILPVLKEVMVRKVLLVEEARIVKKIQNAPTPQPVTLCTEMVEITRTTTENETKI